MARPRITHSWVNSALIVAFGAFLSFVFWKYEMNLTEKKTKEEKQSNMIEWMHQRVEKYILADSLRQVAIKESQRHSRR